MSHVVGENTNVKEYRKRGLNVYESDFVRDGIGCGGVRARRIIFIAV